MVDCGVGKKIQVYKHFTTVASAANFCYFCNMFFLPDMGVP